MNIFVTGCSGYIASRLLPRLRERQHSLVGLDRLPYRGSDLDKFIQQDLRNASLYAGELNGIDCVIHMAAAKGDWGISRTEYYQDNLEATRELLNAARQCTAAKIKEWLFFSTVAVLGPSDHPKGEAEAYAPNHPYGESKAKAEVLFHELVATGQAKKVTILRPSVVFGPDNPDNTNIYRLIDAIYRRKFLMIGDGMQVKTTSYIDNLVAATLFLLEQKQEEALQTFHYVDDPRLSTKELVTKIFLLLQKSPPQWGLPLSLAEPIAQFSDFVGSITRVDLPITRARIKKFCTSTNFDASAIRDRGFEQPVNIDAALCETVRWYLRSIDEPLLAREVSAREISGSL